MFRLYSSTITCKDQMSPALNRGWIGQIVDVYCAVEFSYRTGLDTPDRPSVSGSERTEGNFTFYRPLLVMMVTGIRNSFEEWKANYSWQMDLQEMEVPHGY
jgi:hypothetical protein